MIWGKRGGNWRDFVIVMMMVMMMVMTMYCGISDYSIELLQMLWLSSAFNALSEISIFFERGSSWCALQNGCVSIDIRTYL